jgi:hypothetical protein
MPTVRDDRLWCIAVLYTRLESAMSDLTHVATCIRIVEPSLDPILMDAVAALWNLRDRVFLIAQGEQFDPPGSLKPGGEDGQP